MRPGPDDTGDAEDAGDAAQGRGGHDREPAGSP